MSKVINLPEPTDGDLARFMRRSGVAVDRESYLRVAYFGEIPDPWTREHEAVLTVELQDWDQFE